MFYQSFEIVSEICVNRGYITHLDSCQVEQIKSLLSLYLSFFWKTSVMNVFTVCTLPSKRIACFKEITLLIPMDPYLHMTMKLHLARKKIPKASKMKFFFLEQSTITFLDQSFHLKCLVSNAVFKVPPIATERKIAKLPNCPTTSQP